MNTLHSFLDPTVYLLCRKVCEYKSYTGMKNRSERKFTCRVQSKMHFFCNLVMKIGVLSRSPTCFSRRIHKISSTKVLDNLIIMPKWKCQCFDWIAWEPSSMVKAMEQSNKLNYTDPFKIDQITLHEIFLSLQSFILKVTFIFANIRLNILNINFICNWRYSEYEYMYTFYIPVETHNIQNVWEDVIYTW